VGADEAVSQENPCRFSIRPVPASGSAQIGYNLKAAGPVTLTVYDAVGRSVRCLIDCQTMSAGDHRVVWDCRDGSGDRVGEGVYFLKFETSGTEVIRKLPVVR
jgi:flagellar hook assembly protein FlgD